MDKKSSQQKNHPFDEITVSSLIAAGSNKWTQKPDNLPAFVAEMDFGTAPVIKKAMREVSDKSLWGYLPPGVLQEMRDATSEFLQARYSWTLPAEKIFAVADVLAAFETALDLFCPPDSSIILPTPGYMSFFTRSRLKGRKIIQVPMLRDSDQKLVMDLKGIESAFEKGGHMLILCNPQNPTGRVYTETELRSLSELVENKGGIVFSDEIHAPIVFEDHTHIPYASLSEAAARHTISATSASKAWNIPGLKCAQILVSNENHLTRFEQLSAALSHGASTPGVIANTVAYRDGSPWLEDVLQYIDQNRSLLCQLIDQQLPEITLDKPEGTYITWLRTAGLPDVRGDASWAKFFVEEAGVALTDGALCGEAGKDHLRLVLATPKHVLEKIITKMSNAIRLKEL